jgi:prolactin regulatory element-binding protein
MAGGDGGGDEAPAWGVVGKVTCAAWIRRRGGGASRLLVVHGRGATASSPPLLDLVTFDARACALASEPLVSGPSARSRVSSAPAATAGSLIVCLIFS